MKKDFILQLKRVVSILKLDDKAIAEVSHDASALKWGFGFLFAPAFLNWVIISSQSRTYFGGLFSAFFFWPLFLPPITMALTFYLMSVVAQRFFHGKGNNLAFLRPVLYASFPLAITVILFVSVIIGIFGAGMVFDLWRILWIATVVFMFIVSYKMLKAHHQLHKDDHIIVIIIGVFGYFLIGKILAGLFVGSGVVF